MTGQLVLTSISEPPTSPAQDLPGYDVENDYLFAAALIRTQKPIAAPSKTAVRAFNPDNRAAGFIAISRIGFYDN